jgi:hypothetical protein
MTNQLFTLVAYHFTALTTTFLRRRSMKSVKQLVFAVLLLTALSARTLAGDMSTPGYTTPPPPPPTAEHIMSTSAEADISSSSDPYSEQSGDTVETSDYLLFEAIAALLSVY